MDENRALEAPPRGISHVRSLLRMFVPSATVFFTGGCLMILVLAASRLIARSVGSSFYTWTSVLGVTLTGLALGHYVGGRIADRYHARRALAVLFGLSSAACVGIVVTNNVLGYCAWLWRLSWPGHVLLHVSLVLLVPSALLGAISPVVAKIAVCGVRVRASNKTDTSEEAPCGVTTNLGRTIGIIYGWWVIGGVVGTFWAGFFLIATFGTTAIVWLIGTALLLMAVLYWVSCWAMYLWGMIFIALLTMGMAEEPWAQEAGTAALLRERFDPNTVYEAETPYGHVTVRRTAQRPDRRAFVQNGLTGSEKVIDDPAHLPDFYLKVYAGLTRGLGENKKSLSMLVLGAGGYTFPRYLQATWPDSRVDVVEIDPRMTKAAVNAFGLESATRIRTIHRDARSYVNQLVRTGRMDKAAGRYDFVYEDVLNGGTVPFPLLTREFHEKIADVLADDGAYLIHLPDLYPGGRLLGPVVNTVAAVFAHIYVVVGTTGPAALRDTCVVLAAQRKLDPQAILQERNKHLKFSVLDDTQIKDLKEQCGGILLTDDYAPVESLLTPAVKAGATEILARRYFDRAREFQSRDLPEPGIHAYGQALSLDPTLAVAAYEQIGLIHLARGKSDDAEESFRRAIEAHARTGDGHTAIGAVHMHLGLLLGRADRLPEGKKQLAQAIGWFRIELDENPGNAVLWEQLGETSALLGDYPGASDAFEKAVALEPRRSSHYQKLARALELQRRYDEAVAVVRKQVDLMKEQGRRDQAPQLAQYIEQLQYNKVKRANQ